MIPIQEIVALQTSGGIHMNQETRINKIINESLQAFEHLCLENDLNEARTGGYRNLLEFISDKHYWIKRKAKRDVGELIFKLDAQSGFAVHCRLRKRLFRNSDDASSHRRLPGHKRYWRMILVDHIRNSGVSIRTGYSAESGPWQSGHGVIRIVPYLTETQLFKALLNAFSHQVLHFGTGRATSRHIRPTCLHQSEALALSYVVSRSIGLESLFHDDVRKWNLLVDDEIDWQFRQRIRTAAFALLISLHSHDHFRMGGRKPE
jgi:hypothetical protein